MSALAQCDAFAFIYDQAGDPAPDVLVVLKRVLDASGNPILLGPKTTLTDSAGSFHFTLPELATAFISARASALWNCPDGRAFTVPPGPSGELVPDFSLPASTLVEPPLVYVGDVLSIPKASATQDGYLSAADFVAFEAGAADMGITQIDTGAGLTGGPITDTGTIALQPISGVAGTHANPISITVNGYGQIVAITSGAPDTTPPLITLDAPTLLTGSSVTINWHTNEPADSKVEYSADPDTSYGTPTPITDTTTPVLAHHVLISGLASSQLYHYRVKSNDTAGNPATPVTGTFTTTAVVDTTPPVITLGTPPVDGITHVAAVIHWTTSENADSQVEYSTDTSYGTPTVPPIFNTPTGVMTHAVTLSGLMAATTYNYRVKSKDAAGNPAIPVTGTFMTTAGTLALTDGLVAYWPLDSDFTDAVGSSDWTSTLVLERADVPSPRSVAIFVPGKVGNCASAVDSNSYLSQADNPTFDFSTASGLSIACWVNLDFPTDPSYVFSPINKWAPADPKDWQIIWDTSAARWQFAASSDGFSATVQHVETATPTPVAGVWYFLAGVIDTAAHTISIWTGGGTTLNTPVSAAYTGPIHHSSNTVFGLIWPGALAQGKVDELGIWNRAITASEVAQLFNGGTGLNPLA